MHTHRHTHTRSHTHTYTHIPYLHERYLSCSGMTSDVATPLTCTAIFIVYMWPSPCSKVHKCLMASKHMSLDGMEQERPTRLKLAAVLYKTSGNRKGYVGNFQILLHWVQPQHLAPISSCFHIETVFEQFYESIEPS